MTSAKKAATPRASKAKSTKTTAKKVVKRASDLSSTTADRAAIDADGQREVQQFVEKLSPALRAAVDLVREIVLHVDPSVREGIKWNCPSFRTNEWFATLNFGPPSKGKSAAPKNDFRVVLHTGAKANADASAMKIDDPQGLLKWLGKDRAIVSFESLQDVQSKQTAFAAIVRQWLDATAQ